MDLAKIVQIGASLNPKEEGELIDFLQRNKDVFERRPTDMLGIS
jgi:hypothetical protein